MSNFPLKNYRFVATCGEVKMGFTEVTGLDLIDKTIQNTEGFSRESSAQKHICKKQLNNITLKRGIINGEHAFINWLKGNKIEDRRDLSISLLNENHEPVMTWKIQNSFPLRFTNPILQANGNEVAIEELVLAYEAITLEKG